MLARWKPTERAARVANGFECRPVVDTSDPFGPFADVSIWPDNGPPAPVTWTAADMIAERRRRA